MRTINKRIKAAYHDHLKNTVNVGTYLATFDQRKLEDSKAQLNAVIKSISDSIKSFKQDLVKKSRSKSPLLVKAGKAL